MPLIAKTPADLLAMNGTALGVSDWVLVDQDRINGFANVTGDQQWIHVDIERAKAGPFGGTIAHGYLTLSLLPLMVPQLLVVEQCLAAINIGLDKVRFVSPVRAGSRLRGTGEILTAAQVAPNAVQAILGITIELEGSEKPAAVVHSVVRFIAMA